MHVDKAISQPRIERFIEDKYKKLRLTLGKYDARYVYYQAKAFISMLEFFFKDPSVTGVRLYFASYGPEGGDTVPKDFGELLTLVFAPTKDEEPFPDTGRYYIIFPERIDPDHPQQRLQKI